ncbi:MAG: hypothetical protein NC037_06165 [Bacteroides sp.]|nr:hypothetical protein [Bacteroides sp.]
MKDVGVSKSRITVGFKGIVTDTDESVLDMAYTKRAYNFAFEDGVLTGGIGIDVAEGFYPEPYVERHEYPALPDGKRFKDAFLYRRKSENGEYDDRIVAHLTDYTLMYTSVFKNDTWHEIPDFRINNDITAVNYTFNGEDVLLLCAKNNELFMLEDSTPYVCGNAPQFTSIAVHNERVFGSVNGSQNQVWFSEDFDPRNWTVSAEEGGFINFADECGDVIKLVSFLNYLYIFREFGIFRLTAFGDQSEFMLKKVFTDTGRIVKNSIELCGDKIIFYADDGLFSFDGYEVTRIAKQLMDINRTHLMSCAYLDDYYYMACNILGDGTKNNAVIRYGLRDKSLSVLCGVGVKRLRTVRVHNGTQVLCVFESENTNTLGMVSKSGEVLGTPTKKSYFSPFSALSSPSIKTVRSVSFQTDTDVKLVVRLDKKSYEFNVKGGELMKTVPIEKSGRKIGFEIYCDSSAAHITPLTVQLDTLKI